jgi:hypothetical protein
VQAAETARKVLAFTLATTILLETKKPPSLAKEPVEMSKIKSTDVGAISFPPPELQLVAKPAKQTGNKTAAAPKPNLEKNYFLFIIPF